jgi:hypothetical protein
MFKEFKRKESERINAAQAESDFKLNDKPFVAGDYIVQNADGSLEGVARAEFEEVFEPVRKTWSRKKKAEATSEATPATDQAETKAA